MLYIFQCNYDSTNGNYVLMLIICHWMCTVDDGHDGHDDNTGGSILYYHIFSMIRLISLYILSQYDSIHIYTFELSDSLLQHIVGWVHDSCIDITCISYNVYILYHVLSKCRGMVVIMITLPFSQTQTQTQTHTHTHKHTNTHTQTYE